MMVGVPVLFIVCVGACWPFVCVMAVGVGVSGFWWCVFQWCVAVVLASSVVPGVGVCVSWLVPGACSGAWWLMSGVGGLVWACSCVPVWSGVGVLFSVVAWLVWFRMLTCLASFFFLVFVSCLSCCLVNNGVVVVGRVVWVGLVRWGYWVVVSCCLCLRAVSGVWACVCGEWVCPACVVGVVVWVRGVLLPVACCLLGWVMRLLAAV